MEMKPINASKCSHGGHAEKGSKVNDNANKAQQQEYCFGLGRRWQSLPGKNLVRNSTVP